MPASARAERVVLAFAVVIGVAISFGLAIARLNVSWFGGAVFVIPLAIALFALGRLKWFGALYLIAIVAVAFVAAVWGGFYLYSLLDIGICIFCSAEQARAHTANNMGSMQLVGLAAGAIGSLLTFLALMPLGPKLRDRFASTVGGVGVFALACLGAVGLSGALPGMQALLFPHEMPNARLWQNALFIIPWQSTFGAILAVLLVRHTPLKAQRALPSPA